MSDKIVWESLKDGQYEIVSMTPELMEGGLNVMRNAFFNHEAVCRGVELDSKAAAELEVLCSYAAADGVSLAAVDTKTGAVAAVLYNKIQILPEPGDVSFFETFKNEICKYESSKALIEFMIKADSMCDIFDHYNVDCLFEMMFLATLPEYRGQRLSSKLCEVSIKLAESLKTGEFVRRPVLGSGESNTGNKTLCRIPKVVSAIFTSIYSKKIGDSLQFETLAEINLDTFYFRGKTFASRIGEDTPISTLAAKRLK